MFESYLAFTLKPFFTMIVYENTTGSSNVSVG